MVLVREKSIRDVLGINGQYASFFDFLEQKSIYKLLHTVKKRSGKNPVTGIHLTKRF